MTTEPKHPPDALVREAASFLHLLGGTGSKHLVIVGGMAPPLLVPEAADQHVGSADIDLCLSVAITQGATREYYESIQALIECYYEPVVGSGFRWQKKDAVAGLPLLVDFLAPGNDETPLADGTRELHDPTAAANAGPQLRPLPIRSGRLVDEDAIATTVKGVELVYRQGVRADVVIRHAGPVGFLAAKADALHGRNDSKDGYDVSWWCLNARRTPEEVAGLVTERPAFKDAVFQESVAQIEASFGAPDYVGPDGYAREKHPDRTPGDDVYEQARNSAYHAVSSVIAILKERLW